MNAIDVHRRTEVQEARLLLRWAANELSRNERAALAGFLAGDSGPQIAKRIGISSQGVWKARHSAIAHMRKKLFLIGVQSAEDLLIEE